LHAVPRLDARVEHGRVVVRRDSGVVVEHVDRAVALSRRVHHRLDARLVRHIDLLRERIARVAGDALRGFEVHVGDADLRAFFAEEQRRFAAHASAGARDHADLAVETTHRCQPSVE